MTTLYDKTCENENEKLPTWTLTVQGGLLKVKVNRARLPGDTLRAASRGNVAEVYEMTEGAKNLSWAAGQEAYHIPLMDRIYPDRRGTLGAAPGASGKGTRGVISTFSLKSKKRLLDITARVNMQSGSALFLTFTYPDRFPPPEVHKRHLKALLQEIRRTFPLGAGIWRLEYQDRGAPHYHLLLWRVGFWDMNEIKRIWKRIVGPRYWDYAPVKASKGGQREFFPAAARCPFTDIEEIYSKRKAMRYVSKYMAKAQEVQIVTDEQVDEAGRNEFINVPYWHKGRYWGVHNAQFMPWAELVTLLVDGIEAGFWNLRRAAKRVYPGTWMTSTPQGFTLYIGNADRWLQMALCCLDGAGSVRQHTVQPDVIFGGL